ncbi:DUF932 domain-containing protein (plasmid) [Streptosporangium sp. NBC_01495]|uniref:DUF932 domain-containing protein n=1 Tax=Streptosporangium sp. NBC_01495 TaxID=2903899 RepID=UPI002E363429|nr:DUF932 domain-containing protein [Streptosporangium sp. NBC_01495]
MTSRHATLEDLVSLLQAQHTQKIDLPVEASQMRAVNTQLELRNTPPIISAAGVTPSAGTYRPTGVFDQGLADKLGIPPAYLRKMREEKPRLYDANVNGWLEDDPRRFLVRCLGDGSSPGVARALLSDSYKIIDNLDVLTATLSGIREAGVETVFDGCDLTERRMYVRVVCEQVAVAAPELLRNYRSPFTGASGADNPVVFAGFVITNSETGCGAFTITPRLVVQVCRNGMTINADAERRVHLGARLEDSAVRWSEETQRRNLELITSRTRDVVTSFLDGDYVRAKLDQMAGAARTEIRHPDRTIQVVAKQLNFTPEQQQMILNHFIKGADPTAGGLMHAVTSAAQTLPDGDDAHELERQALKAMQLAAGA